MNSTTALRAPRQPRRCLPALACFLAVLLAACGGGHDDPARDPRAELALYGRVDAAGAAVEAQAFRAGAPAGTASSESTEEGLFSVSLPEPADDVRVAVRTADGARTLSAYLPAVTPSTPIRVDAVTTLADRVRLRGAIAPAAAEARVAAFLALPPGALPQDGPVDGRYFDPNAFQQALQDSRLGFDAFVDRLATEALADATAVRRFVIEREEPAWDDPPLLQSVPFAGDIAAAAAKAALNKVAGGDSGVGAVLANLGFGADARVRQQLAEINRKLEALARTVESNNRLIREAALENKVTALQAYVGKVRTAQAQLEAVASYPNVEERRDQARKFNATVESLLQDEGVFARALLGDVGYTSLAQQYIDLVWSDPSQRFYSSVHQERILDFLDYYDAVNASMYLAFANYYRGLEADGANFSGTLARLDRQLERDRAAYRKLWPQRLPHDRMFIGKTHQVVYSGVRGYGPAEQRLRHVRETSQQERVDWFMPTTMYYEQQHGIRGGAGQKVTQWLYRDFLDYAKAQKKPIGQAVVAAGAPASLAGTGKNAVFLLNEDLQEQRCESSGVLSPCRMVREHTGYVVFDLANASTRDYKVRRPKNNRGHPDLARPVPGNYHYIYARELTPADRALWKVPKP